MRSFYVNQTMVKQLKNMFDLTSTKGIKNIKNIKSIKNTNLSFEHKVTPIKIWDKPNTLKRHSIY